MSARSALRAAGAAGSLVAVALTVHTAWNLRAYRRPPTDPPPVSERVSVLLPLRDEAHRVAPCLHAVLAQERVPDLEVLVLDDDSTDGTAELVHRVAAGDARVRVLAGRPLPAGWLGKAHACDRLAAAATGSVLVFLDADVVLAPCGAAASVTLLRGAGLDVGCPYPRQLADGLGPRLVQPLLQWSFLTTLPLALAERSARPSLSAGNGQLLVIDAATYRRSGGHFAVRGEVLEDVALVRAVKRVAGRGGIVDGTTVATCRMYDGWPDLREGYAKSLWAAFGSPAGAAGALGLLGLAYVVPPLAAVLAGSRMGALGYGVAVLGRWLVARRTRQRVWPDVLAQPASVVVFGWLVVDSWLRRRRGGLVWKGRKLP